MALLQGISLHCDDDSNHIKYSKSILRAFGEVLSHSMYLQLLGDLDTMVCTLRYKSADALVSDPLSLWRCRVELPLGLRHLTHTLSY